MRRNWRQDLGYNAAEVSAAFMDQAMARQYLGDELVDRIVSDALLLMMGEYEDWKSEH